MEPGWQGTAKLTAVGNVTCAQGSALSFPVLSQPLAMLAGPHRQLRHSLQRGREGSYEEECT